MKLIVITGPSGSGKTLLGNKFAESLDSSILIKTDSYYRDNLIIKLLSIFFYDIYDRPISIKDKELIQTINSLIKEEKHITFYNYDFKYKISSKQVRYFKNFKNIRFIILEGIFAHRLNLNYKDSINIICDQKKDVCLIRRITRDQFERGRNINEVIRKFNKSWYLFFTNLKKFKAQNKVTTLRSDDNVMHEKIINKLDKQNKKETKENIE
tara:strand:+ start:416 stop:1048 length:633 start_codon:yes stop_codon:yes gene_type:complete